MSAIITHRQTTPLLPKRSRLTALHLPAKETRPQVEGARARLHPPRATSSKWLKNPSLLSSLHRARYHPGTRAMMATQTDRHRLAADTAGLPPAFYSEHTPRLTRLKHLSDQPGTGYHAGRMSPSPVIHVHHTIGHVA